MCSVSCRRSTCLWYRQCRTKRRDWGEEVALGDLCRKSSGSTPSPTEATDNKNASNRLLLTRRALRCNSCRRRDEAIISATRTCHYTVDLRQRGNVNLDRKHWHGLIFLFSFTFPELHIHTPSRQALACRGCTYKYILKIGNSFLMCIPSSKIVISSISSSFFYKKMKTLPVATCSSLFLLANVKLSQNTSSAVNEMTTCKFNRNVLSIMFCLLFVSLVRLPYLIDTAPSGR